MIALIGNPNCGKSALFNYLTHSNQKIGNFAGVTVDVKEGFFNDVKIIDLPGIYSLRPYTKEEKITVDYLKKNKISLILNVVDINCLNRSLYLTSMLKKLNIPMILILTKDDGLNKTKINLNKLEKELSLKVISVSVFKNKNLKLLKELIVSFKNLPLKNIDIKLNDEWEIDLIYHNIDKITDKVIIKNNNTKLSKIIDNILLNKYLSFIISIFILIIVYYISIKLLGDLFVNIVNKQLEYIINLISGVINSLDISLILKDLIINGIISGMGSIFTFIPQIVILMFIFSILEDTGYISRMALSFDSFLRKIGLSSKSFSSLLLGTSCSALAIISTRTIKDNRERNIANLLIPFIPCSAKVPIILFFLKTFFNNSFILFLSFYLLAIIVIIVLSLIFKKDDNSSYILELPVLKLPNIKIAIKDTYNKTSSFIKRICSIILLFSIINWFLLSFDIGLNYGCKLESSLLYFLSSKISFLTIPFTGINDPKILISILTGFLAKEQVVSTLGILKPNIDVLNVYSFICFNLFTIPCINTLFALKQECGSKFLLLSIFIQVFISFFVSTLIYRVILWIFL